MGSFVYRYEHVVFWECVGGGVGIQVLTAAWETKWWRRRREPSVDGGVGNQVLTAAWEPSIDGIVGNQVLTAAWETKFWRRRGKQSIDGGVGHKVLTAAWETKLRRQRGNQSSDDGDGIGSLKLGDVNAGLLWNYSAVMIVNWFFTTQVY